MKADAALTKNSFFPHYNWKSWCDKWNFRL